MRSRTAGCEIVRSFYSPDPKLPPVWLVDLDGTLAKMVGRSPYDWKRVGEDLPNEPVVEILRSLNGAAVGALVVSGRDGSCRQESEDWLSQHQIPYHHLYMRAAGDTRKDSIVKAEIFWREIAPYWNVKGVLDDRDQVVEMWRSLGLTCLQVAPGDF